MDFEVVGDITGVETISSGSGIRERGRLRKWYGARSLAQLQRLRRDPAGGGRKSSAPSHTGIELHWYEATGIGKHEMKIKAFL